MEARWSRVDQLLAAVASVGIAASGLGTVVGPRWLVLVGSALVAVAAVGKLVAVVQGQRVERQVERSLLGSGVDFIKPIGQLDAFELRVEKATARTNEPLPRYQQRLIDDVLDTRLREALNGAGQPIVMLDGHSGVGKSRAIYEAVRRLDPSLVVVKPDEHAGIVNLIAPDCAPSPPRDRRCVLWLDDIERFVAQGTTHLDLLRWCDLPGVRIVVATRGGKGAPHIAHNDGPSIRSALDEIVGRCEPVAMQPITCNELDRAVVSSLTMAERSTVDRYGYGAFLLAVAELERTIGQCRHGNEPPSPAGMGVVRAAVEWTMCGRLDPCDPDSLFGIWRHAAEPGVEVSRGEFDEAVAWATRQIRTTVALVDHHRGGFSAGDLTVQLLSGVVSPSGTAWQHSLETESSSTLQAVGVAAYRRSDYDRAIVAWRRAAALDHADAMSNLGVLLKKRGDIDGEDGAEAWYRRAAALDHADAMSNLGVLLKKRGDIDGEDGAEAWYRRAAALDHADAMSNLGVLLNERGDIDGEDGAEAWWRRAAALDHADAMSNLGVLLKKRGDIDGEDGAEAWYRRAAALDHADAMYNLGVLLKKRGDIDGEDGAEAWWRRAAALDHADAMYNLGVLLNERGDIDGEDGAEAWYRRAAALDHAGAMSNLGVLLKKRGDIDGEDGAEAWYRRAAALDHAGAMSNLGVLLNERGDIDGEDGAEAWWRRAAALDHAGAMSNLGVLLKKRGDIDGEDGAEAWYRRAAALDHAGAMYNLGVLLNERGDIDGEDGAEAWWRRAAALDHAGAMYNLGVLLNERGDIDGEDGAEAWWRRACDRGLAVACERVKEFDAGP